MKHRNIHDLFQGLLDDKTLRCLNVFEVDAAKGRTHELHSIDKFFGVFGVQLNIDRVHICKALKQNRLAFHDRLGAQSPKIAKTQNRCSVRNHRHKVALVGIVIGQFRIIGDGQTGHRNTWRIGQGKITLCCHWHRGGYLKLTRRWFQVVGQRISVCDFVIGHCNTPFRISLILNYLFRWCNSILAEPLY